MKAQALVFDQPLSYDDGVALQERLVDARVADEIPDTVIFLEHQPVVTLGSRGNTEHLLMAPDKIRASGVHVAQSSRGGDITYHAPGQLVMYPILQLADLEASAHGYLARLEDIAIRTAADFGVAADRREGMTGAWTAHGKICAIGIRLKRWVTMHGLAFNIDVDLGGFDSIVPCGLVGESVTSLRALVGEACPSLEEVRTHMATHFEVVCEREIADWQSGEAFM